MKQHINNKTSSGIKYTEIPNDETIIYNSVPPSLTKDECG